MMAIANKYDQLIMKLLADITTLSLFRAGSHSSLLSFMYLSIIIFLMCSIISSLFSNKNLRLKLSVRRPNLYAALTISGSVSFSVSGVSLQTS